MDIKSKLREELLTLYNLTRLHYKKVYNVDVEESPVLDGRCTLEHKLSEKDSDCPYALGCAKGYCFTAWISLNSIEPVLILSNQLFHEAFKSKDVVLIHSIIEKLEILTKLTDTIESVLRPGGPNCSKCKGVETCPGSKNQTSSILKYNDHEVGATYEGCQATCDLDYCCTRPEGHTGDHEATNKTDKQVAIWPE